MKKTLSLILALALCLSLCACGDGKTGNTNPESTAPQTSETTIPTTEAPLVIHKIGDAISTDAMKVVLTKVNFSDMYAAYQPNDDGYTFLIVEFTVENIGKTEFEAFSVPGGSTTHISKMVQVNYDNGYMFCLDDVNCLNIGNCDESCFRSSSKTVKDLKPLGETITMEVAILVPGQVAENTTAPLCIRFLLQNSNGELEEVEYTIR